MTDEPLEVPVVHKMPDRTFAAADALQKLRIVKDGFNSAADAEKIHSGFLSGAWRYSAAQGEAIIVWFVRAATTAIHRAPVDRREWFAA
jgi:hypothetical protein